MRGWPRLPATATLGPMDMINTSPRLPDEHLWQQVVARGTGDFLYAVTTMGVYCRPGCPSPRPLRRNVRFFANAEEAEAAGFRACKRCDPKGERAGIARAVVRDAGATIEAADEIPSLDSLAARAGYSRFHFLRMFRDHTGLTPRAYAAGIRAQKLAASLAAGTRVADAVAEAGYGSESRVYEKLGTLLGMTPGAARRGGAGEVIRTGTADCPLGKLLVAATDKGICFIGFVPKGKDAQSIVRERFPRAEIEADDAALTGVIGAVLDFLAEPQQALGLPLDLRGTAFQQLVWRTLTRIPPGETRSYAQVAAMIGKPRASRAVARCCAENPVAIAVPCHRVIGSDGQLRGYRWGLSRKQELLRREGEATKNRSQQPR